MLHVVWYVNRDDSASHTKYNANVTLREVLWKHVMTALSYTWSVSLLRKYNHDWYLPQQNRATYY